MFQLKWFVLLNNHLNNCNITKSFLSVHELFYHIYECRVDVMFHIHVFSLLSKGYIFSVILKGSTQRLYICHPKRAYILYHPKSVFSSQKVYFLESQTCLVSIIPKGYILYHLHSVYFLWKPMGWYILSSLKGKVFSPKKGICCLSSQNFNKRAHCLSS